MNKSTSIIDPNKRSLLKLAAGLAASPCIPWSSNAQAQQASGTFRIGFQKGGPVLIVARQRSSFEKGLTNAGVSNVSWAEFQFGPPLLEAMSAGAVDIGSVGDAPAIFSQAGRGDVAYVLAMPSAPHSVLVPKGSPLRTLADLRGKRVAFGKGSSAHNVVLKALRVAGLTYNQIDPIYLAPAEAMTAFASEKVDAWVTWDPYWALAEERLGARSIADTSKTPQLAGYVFYMANRQYAQSHSDVTRAAVDVVIENIKWAANNRREVASLLSQSTGLDLSIQQRAIDRTDFTYSAVTEAVIKAQQETADQFLEQKLIPARINVRDIVWRG